MELSGRSESDRCPVSRARLRSGRGAFAGGRPGFWRDRREPRFSGDSDERGTTHVGGIAAIEGGSGGNIPRAAGGWLNAGAGRLRPRIFCALPVAVVTYTIVYSIPLANDRLCVILLFSSPLQFTIDP